MSDFTVRSDNVDVEQIMKQIRSRIRDKRGVDYTEEEIRELANVKLEKFLDPRGVKSGLLEEFQRARAASTAPRNFAFGDETLYETHRGFIRWIRKLLNPLLKLFFNPNPLIQALHIQADLNATREKHDALTYELVHNLVLELTRLGIEVKNLKMRVESMSSRLDFDERRARALEGVVQYRPGAVAPLQPPPGRERDRDRDGDTAQERRTRRRRRRGRRPGGPRDGAENGATGDAGDNDGPELTEQAAGAEGRRGESSERAEGPKPFDHRAGDGGAGPRKPDQDRAGVGE